MYSGAVGSKRGRRSGDETKRKIRLLRGGGGGGGDETGRGATDDGSRGGRGDGDVSVASADPVDSRLEQLRLLETQGLTGGCGDGEAGAKAEERGEGWALQLLLDEVKRAAPDRQPMGADALFRQIEQRYVARYGPTLGHSKWERLRWWSGRAARTLVFWAAAVAGSRAFRMLTL